MHTTLTQKAFLHLAQNSLLLIQTLWEQEKYVQHFRIYTITHSLCLSPQIVVKGRNIFMGYLWDPQATADAFDPKGCFVTGDIGNTNTVCSHLNSKVC